MLVPEQSALMTDLYELTMAQAFFRSGMTAPATFSLFVRRYPAHRGYLVNAGLADVLELLENYRFEGDELDFLESTGLFGRDFLDFLARLRFSGQVRALAEGRIFFKDEPILEVSAPIIEAQLVETAVINAVNLQVTLATKVSRCVQAARGRGVVDFALRRTQGSEAGLKLARAGYIAGLQATSNVLAGRLYGLPLSGTMAHSYVTSFDSEIEAFRHYAEIYGDRTVLLIDTFDTLSGARKAAQVASEMAAQGKRMQAVRLDSGDMVTLSCRVRAILDDLGCRGVRIFASGGFDEYKIADYLARGALIDGFGVGTKMGVSADVPYTDMAYKLVQFDGRPVLKLSSGKKTLVGEKQVFRIRREGRLYGDVIGLRREIGETLVERGGDLEEPLLQPVMKDGRRLGPPSALETLREQLAAELAALPDEFRRIREPARYPVEVSAALSKLQRQVVHRVMEKELGES